MMGGLAELAEASPLVRASSPSHGRKIKQWSAVAVGLAVACVCLVAGRAAVTTSMPTVLQSRDPRMGGMDGLGLMGANQRMAAPASAQQLAVDPMSDVRERANGQVGYVPRQARRGSIWEGLDDSVGRLPGVNVDAWGAMKERDGVETPAMMRRMRRIARQHQLAHIEAGGALSRLPSEQQPDVLERVRPSPTVVVVRDERVYDRTPEGNIVQVREPVVQGVLARTPETGEGDGLLGRIAAPQFGEEGGSLMATGEDEKTAEGALMQTGNDDAATEGVLSHDFGLDSENTGGSLFMQSVHSDDGWEQAPSDTAWASPTHDNSWKLDTSKSAGGSLAQMKGDDMAQGALSSLTAQQLTAHKTKKAVVHALHGGEDVTGSLIAAKTKDAEELVDGSLAASKSSFGDAGSLSRVKTIDEVQAETAAGRKAKGERKASEAVHTLKGGEEVKGSLSVAPTEHEKELVDGSLAATKPAYGHDGSLSRVKGISAEKQSSGRKVVVEATMAEAIADKIHAAEEVAKKMNNVGKGREAKVKEQKERAHAAAEAAQKSEEVKEQEQDVQNLVKRTMSEIRKQHPSARAAPHIDLQSKGAHSKHKHADASGSAVKQQQHKQQQHAAKRQHTQQQQSAGPALPATAAATLQAKKGFEIFPKEHKMNLLNQTEGGEGAEDEVDLGDNWDDVGWVKHRWTLTTWALFVLSAPIFTILVTGLVGHSAGVVAAVVTFIILLCMDIACYYYSWYLF